MISSIYFKQQRMTQVKEAYREAQNKKQRERRARDNNKNTKRYEKTKKGFLVRCYRNMLSRVRGIVKSKRHLYMGKCILDKEDFYEFSLSDEHFLELFSEWENNDYERRLTPSIDRMNPSKGYSLDNIQWVTFSENCRRVSRKQTKQ